MTSENPAPETPAPSPAGGSAAMLARLGRNEQLVIAGAAAVIVADLIGGLTQEWSLQLAHWSLILGSLAAAGLVLSGAGRAIAGLPGRSIIRILAAIVGAYGLVDLGDLLSSLGDWSTIDIVLTIIEIAGVAVLVWGAWALDGASLTADVRAAAQVTRLGMNDGLLYAGAVGVVVGWFLLMAIADIFDFHITAQIAVMAAVLALTVRWLARNPSAGSLPVSTPWAIAALGGLVVVLGLWWLVQVIGETLELGDLTIYIPMLIYVAALAALAAGAFLGLGKLAPPAPSGPSTPPAPPAPPA